MQGSRRGVLLGLGAYLIWGLFPLYWPLLKPASALEILAHRILWSLVFVTVLLLLRRRWAWLGALRGDRRRLTLLAVASIAIAFNWGIYIYGVNSNQVVETALGYFINPLVTVSVGVVVLKERLRRGQWLAVGLAAVAVIELTVAYGRPPWLALALAISFATYGFAKKTVAMPAMESLGVETALLAIPAVLLVTALEIKGTAAFGHAEPHVTILLALAGIVTAVPLLMFGAAAPRIPLTTIGLLQYVTPTIQFLLGVTVFHESMPPSQWLGFVLVWAALAIFSVDSLRASQPERRMTASQTLTSASLAAQSGNVPSTDRASSE
jgi:chloramphenicol-sensitive protein RarD